MKALKIDSEFHNLIPPLTPEEYAGLEQNLINEGFNSTVYGCITVWDDTIVDGHNRYEICTRNNIPYATEEKTFNSRDDAFDWIINNQLRRRNITPYQRATLALRLKPLIEKKAKENLKTHTEQGLQNSVKAGKIDTQKELAKVAGVSHDTIWKVEKIQEKATDEVKQKVKIGDMSVNKAYKTIKPQESIAVIMLPDKQKETEKKSTEAAEKITESIFDISRFERVANHFICEINPLSMGYTMFANMDDGTRQKYIAQINDIRRWLVKIENIIKGGK